jgi:hypothetical protein
MTKGSCASMSGLIATIERRPQAAFAVFLALHFLVWTALPALLYPNLPLDRSKRLLMGANGSLVMTSCRHCHGG